jgi:sarcosine/dimethylglycine N-methyltransferase
MTPTQYSGNITTGSYSEGVAVARSYYNSSDADRFYFTIWGGEDIHIGLYQSPTDPIAVASRRTVETMAQLLPDPSADWRILDIGSGYGGAARYLAQTWGCRVTALNLSEVENQRNRQLCQQQGLAEQIDVVDGSFEQIPCENAQFDLVWSQDAILHSGDREQVLREVVRVLKPGGIFIFTDPMQSDSCPEGVLQPILDRIHLTSLGSPGFYRQTAQALGLIEVAFVDHTPQLVEHYRRVLAETEHRSAELAEQISPDYIERMKKGLRHWIEGGQAGHLAWGILMFRKPS